MTWSHVSVILILTIFESSYHSLTVLQGRQMMALTLYTKRIKTCKYNQIILGGQNHVPSKGSQKCFPDFRLEREAKTRTYRDKYENRFVGAMMISAVDILFVISLEQVIRVVQEIQIYCLPKGPNAVISWVAISTYKFCGDTIQSITTLNAKFGFKDSI